MNIQVHMTPGLRVLLREAHDDGQDNLVLYQCEPRRRPDDWRVVRVSGEDLSETEAREVRALLAAHAAEEL